MTVARSNSSLDDAIGQATIAAVGSLSAAQLLSAVTPERIGELTGYSASSIRYRLNAAAGSSAPTPPAGRTRGWSFDRERLLTCALEAYRVHARQMRERARDRYALSIDAFATGNSRPLEQALEAEIAGLASGDTERLYLLALAGGQEAPSVARLLRQVETDRRAVNGALVDRGLQLLGRRALPGLGPEAVGEAVNHYLHGLSMRRTFEPAAGAGAPLRAVLGLVLALTAPAEPTPAPVSALLAELGLLH